MLTAKGPGLVAWWNFLGETEIDEANVTVVIDHQVFRFQITVAVVTLVEVIERFNHTGDVEPGHRIVEWSFSMQRSPQITTQIGVCQQKYEFRV